MLFSTSISIVINQTPNGTRYQNAHMDILDKQSIDELHQIWFHWLLSRELFSYKEQTKHLTCQRLLSNLRHDFSILLAHELHASVELAGIVNLELIKLN